MPYKRFLLSLLFIIPGLASFAQHDPYASAKPKSKIVVSTEDAVEPAKNTTITPAPAEQKVMANVVIPAKTVSQSIPQLENKPAVKVEPVVPAKVNKTVSATVAASAKLSAKTEAEQGSKPCKPAPASFKAASASPVACKVPNVKESDLKGGYKNIPLVGQKSYYGEMNDFAFNFTKQYLSAHNKSFSAVRERGEKSFPVMEGELKKHNIPQELKYLAVIESALNNKAVSHAGAVGPWQLMSSTARLMGLSVNRKHDDRKDWNRSTNAAAKYLSILYDQLNDWLLVIAAYNSGPSPVQRAIERTGSHNFWEIKPYLPRETQGHVLAFIATASIFENLNNFISLGEIPDDLKLDKDGKPVVEIEQPKATNEKDKAIAAQPKSPFSVEELQRMSIVNITEPLSMELLANELSIDLKLLNKWNPDYQLFVYNTYPTKDYKLRIPKDKLENFVQKKQFIEKKSKQILIDQKM